MQSIIFQHTLIVPKFFKTSTNKPNPTQTPLYNIPKSFKNPFNFIKS